MKKLLFILIGAGVVFGCFFLIPNSNTQVKEKTNSRQINIGNFAIGDGIGDKDLTIYPIYSREKTIQKKYVPLQKALAKKWVTLHETGSVNQLSIDNHSNHYVYLQSGDIVKGGQQDRTMQYDVIVPPNSNGQELASFCVEQGRWSAREGEASHAFTTSTRCLPSKSLKVAAAIKGNQSEVWSKVQEEKNRYNANLSAWNSKDVQIENTKSSSSLQLMLENDAFNHALDSLISRIDQNFPKDSNIIGVAYAYRGKVQGIEMYNNPGLFIEMKDKLFEMSASMALAEWDSTDCITTTKKDVARMFARKQINSVSSSHVQSNKITSNNIMIAHSANTAEIITHDKLENNWIHKSIMAVDSADMKAANSSSSIDLPGLLNLN